MYLCHIIIYCVSLSLSPLHSLQPLLRPDQRGSQPNGASQSHHSNANSQRVRSEIQGWICLILCLFLFLCFCFFVFCLCLQVFALQTCTHTQRDEIAQKREQESGKNARFGVKQSKISCLCVSAAVLLKGRGKHTRRKGEEQERMNIESGEAWELEQCGKEGRHWRECGCAYPLCFEWRMFHGGRHLLLHVSQAARDSCARRGLSHEDAAGIIAT